MENENRINCLDREIRYQGHASKKRWVFTFHINFRWQIHNPTSQTLFYDFYATNKYILFLNRASKESIMWLLCIYSLWHTSNRSTILLKMGYSILPPPCSQSIKLKIPYDTICGFLVDWIENTASLLFQFMKYDVSIHFVQYSTFYSFLAYSNMFLLSFEMYSYILMHLNFFSRLD